MYYILIVLLSGWMTWKVVQELLKALSDKKAPDRARLGALSCLALLAEQREGWEISMDQASYPRRTL